MTFRGARCRFRDRRPFRLVSSRLGSSARGFFFECDGIKFDLVSVFGMRPRLDPLPHLEDMGRYARVLTKNDADAEELVQEALMRGLAVANTCDLSRPLLPWLIRIVRNTHLTNVARRHVESRSVSDLAVLTGSVEMPAQEHHADLNRVQRAIETLPTEHAEVLHLVGALGFSYSDSANILGIPAGTLMSRLSRARAALKRALEAPVSRSPELRVIEGKRR